MTERDNGQWIRDLSSPLKRRTAALEDLREILLRGLDSALKNWVRQDTREFISLAEDFVQEALLVVLKRMDTFQGLSRFTTWAHKICIRIALSELRRQRWKDFSLEAQAEESSLFLSESGAQDPAHQAVDDRMFQEWLMKIIQEELSPRQRTAIKATVLHGVSADALAEKLGTNRNALYKLLHDARLKLKKRILKDERVENDGYLLNSKKEIRRLERREVGD